MGVNHSKSDASDEKVFQNETSISVSSSCSTSSLSFNSCQFSPDVVNHLSDRLEGPETTPERQLILDAHIRERIRDELEHLKRDEQSVRREIEQALERENLDRESSMAGEAPKGESAVGGIKNSVSLLGDLEEIRTKIEKYQSNRRAPEFPGVEESGVAVAECYKYVHLVGIITPPRPFFQEKQGFSTPVLV